MTTSDSWSVYPIRYTQAECEKIKSRKDFAELFMRAFGEDIVKQCNGCVVMKDTTMEGSTII